MGNPTYMGQEGDWVTLERAPEDGGGTYKIPSKMYNVALPGAKGAIERAAEELDLTPDPPDPPPVPNDGWVPTGGTPISAPEPDYTELVQDQLVEGETLEPDVLDAQQQTPVQQADTGVTENDVAQEMLAGAQQQAEAVAEVARVQGARAEWQAMERMEQARRIETEVDEFRSHMEKARLDIDQQSAQLAQDIDAFAKIETDPDRAWHDKSSAKKSLAILGAFMDGWLGKNDMVKAVTAQINRDIKAQQMDMQRQGKALTARQSLLSLNMTRYQDERTAMMQTYNMMVKGFDAKLEAIGAKFDSPEIQARARGAQAMLRREVTREISGWVDGQRALAQTDYGLKTGRRSQMETARANKANETFRKNQAAAKKTLADAAALDAKQKLYIRDPKTGQNVPIATTERDSKETVIVQKQLNAYRSSRPRMIRYKELVAEIGATMKATRTSILAGGFDDELSAKIQEATGIYHKLLQEDIRAMSGAQASEQEVKRLQKSLPGLETLSGADPMPAIEAFIVTMDAKIDDAVAGAGASGGYRPSREFTDTERAAVRRTEKASRSAVANVRSEAETGFTTQELAQHHQRYKIEAKKRDLEPLDVEAYDAMKATMKTQIMFRVRGPLDAEIGVKFFEEKLRDTIDEMIRANPHHAADITANPFGEDALPKFSAPDVNISEDDGG